MYVFEGTNGLCVARDTILVLETDGPGIEAGVDRSIRAGMKKSPLAEIQQPIMVWK